MKGLPALDRLPRGSCVCSCLYEVMERRAQVTEGVLEEPSSFVTWWCLQNKDRGVPSKNLGQEHSFKLSSICFRMRFSAAEMCGVAISLLMHTFWLFMPMLTLRKSLLDCLGKTPEEIRYATKEERGNYWYLVDSDFLHNPLSMVNKLIVSSNFRLEASINRNSV